MSDETPSRSIDVRNTGEYVKLRALYTQVKQENAVLATRAEKAETELAARDKELTEARTAVDQNALLKENRALKDQIRTDRHRVAFFERATAKGVRPNARDDAWEKSGYQAEGDEPNTEAMDAALEGLKKSRDYLFAQPQAEGEGQPSPGPGRGQGGAAGGNGKMRVTREQLADYDFARNYADVLRKGEFEIVG
jgi:hypothetical protein